MNDTCIIGQELFLIQLIKSHHPWIVSSTCLSPTHLFQNEVSTFVRRNVDLVKIRAEFVLCQLEISDRIRSLRNIMEKAVIHSI